jgi:5'-phosphate synthase pdxT subunit
MKIGVLALQGDFTEHLTMLCRIGAQAVEVRLPKQLDDLDGLIIPGGESTTIGKLAVAYGLMEPLQAFGQQRAIWGTCAGAIFLSKDIHRRQPLLKLMDIIVERNAFGRQVDSFEVDLTVRAPLIESVQDNVQVLAKLTDGRIVAARQGRLLATSFHPELTSDDRFHRYFLSLAH